MIVQYFNMKIKNNFLRKSMMYMTEGIMIYISMAWLSAGAKTINMDFDWTWWMG